MKLIVGLGNPGKQYEGTRHNAGFMFLDKLVSNSVFVTPGEEIQFSKEEKFDSLIAQTVLAGEKFIFVKPQTFMNLSGNAVAEIMQYYKISPEDLIVVSDDADLPIGTSRIRTDGSSGGQKGLQSIIDILNLNTFVRVRIGIKALASDQDEADNLSQISLSDFVLSKFDKREEKVLEASIDETIGYILPFLTTDHEIVPHTIEAKINT